MLYAIKVILYAVYKFILLCIATSNIPAVDAGLEHFEFEEVEEEEVAAQIERGYWDNICYFWNMQPDLERTPSDMGLPSWSSGVAGSEKLNK